LEPAATAGAPKKQDDEPSPAARIPRAVVRYERAGRGGKAVTVIEQLNLDGTERERWLKALKAALGCGGSIEGPSIMLQGDQRERLPKWLVARGVRKVTIS
jgi:translation initiation factor 1